MFYTLGLGLQQASCFGKTFTGVMCFFFLGDDGDDVDGDGDGDGDADSHV